MFRRTLRSPVCTLCARSRVLRAPGFPCALFVFRGHRRSHPFGRLAPRECEGVSCRMGRVKRNPFGAASITIDGYCFAPPIPTDDGSPLRGDSCLTFETERADNHSTSSSRPSEARAGNSKNDRPDILRKVLATSPDPNDPTRHGFLAFAGTTARMQRRPSPRSAVARVLRHVAVAPCSRMLFFSSSRWPLVVSRGRWALCRGPCGSGCLPMEIGVFVIMVSVSNRKNSTEAATESFPETTAHCRRPRKPV